MAGSVDGFEGMIGIDAYVGAKVRGAVEFFFFLSIFYMVRKRYHIGWGVE